LSPGYLAYLFNTVLIGSLLVMCRGKFNEVVEREAQILDAEEEDRGRSFAGVEILQASVQGPSLSVKKAHVGPAWHFVSPSGVPPNSIFVADPAGCPFPRYA
jgi:hypothetical protein